MKPEDLYPRFAEGPRENRSTLFWAWNGRLEKGELSRQIGEFAKAGLGGFLMHSRDGLETAYLGEEWDGAVRHSVDEAKRLGLEAWLYDEDRWPSGSCGGRISSLEEGRYALKGLTLEVCPGGFGEGDGGEPLRAAYAARVEGHDILSCRRTEPGENLRDGETLLLVRFETSGGSEWFNGSPPPDNLNPDTVGHFLASTHGHYASYLKGEFGGAVPAIFTDEPSLADRHARFPANRGWIPWSRGMEDFYAGLGYGDIYETLPYLYFNGSRSPEVRFRYWHCLALRFEETFSGQIGEWCRREGLKFSGHYLQEDKTGLSTRVNGSIMPHYVHQDIPGVDLLTESTGEYLTLKQCSSVVHQYGKEGMIAETYAATGWDFTPEGMKWIGDWEYALGVTRRCLHLSLYSLKGERKRDYPPSFLDHNPLWPLMAPTEEYFSRLSHLLRQGRVVRNVLFIHPAGSVWTGMGCSPYGNPLRREERDVPQGDRAGFALNDTLAYLCLRGRDADLGDETLLARDGSAAGGKLRLGLAEYDAVVLPGLDSLYRSTFALLRDFAAGGGTILIQDRVPRLLEGREEGELNSFFAPREREVLTTREDLLEALDRTDPPLFRLTGKGGERCTCCVSQLRRDGDRLLLFLANNDRVHPFEGTLFFRDRGALFEAELAAGTFREIRPEHSGGEGLTIPVKLEACGSLFYILDGSVPEILPCPLRPLGDGPVPVRMNQANQFLLDYGRYALGGDLPEGGEGFIWQINRKVRERLDMRQTDGGEGVQRYAWIDSPHPRDGAPLSLSFDFTVAELPGGPLWVSLEERGSFRIFLNGQEAKGEGSPSPLYGDLALVELPPPVIGKNTLELTCAFRETLTLEAAILTGDFSVSPERILSGPVAFLRPGDWTEQGLFHYGGAVTYLYDFLLPDRRESVRLRLPPWKGAGLRIACGGRETYVLSHGQGTAEITDAVETGTNRVEITLFGSLRNLLGPLHLQDGERAFINPDCYLPEGEDLCGDYRVEPYGLFGVPEVELG